ncbi:MAG TPA: UDP-N-acetylmuramoyl-L-alanyl-D-glutamate--2,6-diaminopimelate ligase [Candidatus Cybelea sp.]|jgi:UDP-N-acetylmuramoyl-L-alanyl-D-glutamate--2,6-diaminopimelate ligase
MTHNRRHKRFSELLERLPQGRVLSGRAELVSGIEIDSRAVTRGDLFVALRGEHTDGHRFVGDALRRGAAAVVVETSVEAPDPDGAAVVCVPDTKRALSQLAAAFYGDPSRGLDVIAVTGTNGKTTVTHMVCSVLDAAGIDCGVIGTVGAQFGNSSWGLHNTTPLPPELHGVLAAMRDDGARAVALEVSSHALALGRVEDVVFSLAALTNVTRDHLDFHGSHDAYAAAKRRLFEMAPKCAINIDDVYGAAWALELRRSGHEVIAYGSGQGADLVPEQIVVGSSGSSFIVNRRQYELALPGRFNVWNALAAIGIARFMQIDDETIANGLASLQRVPGRMERVHGLGIDVVVDYAHTPDALRSALLALGEMKAGALAVVFGCGGDRDRGKRAEMGAIAAELADRIYLTNDNPRSEEPEAIVRDIVDGIADGHRYQVELDRRTAIERAIAQARAGDVVLVAGKGHESYQIIGDRVLSFDDLAVAREALAKQGTLH